MPVAYMSAAVFSGFIMSALWLFADGAWWSAILVYIMSGNLVLAGLLMRVVLRDARTEIMPSDDEKHCATEA